jgi:hypothetical protein
VTRLLVLAAVSAVLPAAAGCGSKGETAGAAPPAAVAEHTGPPPAGERVENPTYKLWANFPAGTSVTQRTTTENENNTQKTVTTITYTLREKTDDRVVVESRATTVHYTGRVEENPPAAVTTRRYLTLPPGAGKEDWGKPPAGQEEGEEVVTAAGKEYKARWYKSQDTTDAGPLYAQTWTSADIPGGLVKSVSKVPAKQATITVEVTHVHIP